jgi:hypothetical protein
MIRRGVIRAFDRQAYTASVEVVGGPLAFLPGVPVSHALDPWVMRAGVACVIQFFDESDPADACVVGVYGGRPPRDPHFDPSLGHRHRGLEDDGPIL